MTTEMKAKIRQDQTARKAYWQGLDRAITTMNNMIGDELSGMNEGGFRAALAISEAVNAVIREAMDDLFHA